VGMNVSDQTNNWRCALQGVLDVYGGLATGMWWVILSINLFLQIVKEKSIPPHWEKYYLIAGWGFPLVIIIIALGLSAFAYEYGTSFCFFYTTTRIYLVLTAYNTFFFICHWDFTS